MPTEAAPRVPLSRADKVIGARTPERLVGGFSRRDSTFLFYSLIHSVLEPGFRVLDFGAGRGAQGEIQWPYKRDLLNLKGKVARVVGVDVDDAVLTNPMLDEALVFVPGDRLPFEDASFDLIFSDWVLEHVDNPEFFAAEIRRLLKPGGWFFARTPNRFGAVALGGSLVPNSLHTKALRFFQPDRKAEDVFPTRYRLNTRSALKRWFRDDHFENYSTTLDSEMMYLATRPMLFEIAERLGRLLPSALRPVLIVALRKRQ